MPVARLQHGLGDCRVILAGLFITTLGDSKQIKQAAGRNKTRADTFAFKAW